MAAISPVADVGTFLEGLERSGLLDGDTLAVARAAATNSPDPKSLARDLVVGGLLTKWQASQLLHGFHQLIVGKFKLLDQVGSSEFGRTYLAEHAHIGRKHLLKVLAKRHTANPAVVQAFLADAAAACGLDHRNISHTYDVIQEGDRCYVVMEHVEGEDLEKMVQRGTLSPPLALELVRQAAEGLAHAHDGGVIHGVLKPSSLLLDESGTVKILDIGQSRLLASPAASDESQQAATVAAALFRAPELRGAKPPAAEVSSDMYSLGSVLCYLLTGKPAADVEEATGELAARQLPEEITDLCRFLMADDPQQRPAAMKEVLVELAAASRAAAALARPDKAAGAPAGETKKPPVSKPLTDSAALPVAKAVDPPVEFSIQAAGRGKKPPVRKAADAPGSVQAPAASKNLVPLLIAAAIGGSVLVLGGIGVLVAMFAFGGREKPVAQAPQPKAVATAQAVESNPAESNPVEANPAAANPAASPQAADAKNPFLAFPAAPAKTPDSKTEPVPPAGPPKAEPTPEPSPPAPVSTAAAPEPAPEPMPKAKSPKAKTEPKAKPKAEPNPFEGFAKAVALPLLPEGTAQPASDALAPQSLGPCQTADDAIVLAKLKGGETAIRGGKQKLDLQPKGGTAPRDWEFQLIGGDAPLVIATLAAKEDSLVFQWTEAGAKHAAQARQLCNCALDLAAGAGKHVVALRQPASGQPLVVDFEKATSVKWTIENLPDPKSIHVEATRFDGLPRQKLQPSAAPLGDELVLWTGPAEDAMFLSLKLVPSAQGRGVQLAAQPQVKLQGMTKATRFSKKEAAASRQAADAQLANLTGQLNLLSKKKAKKGDAVDQAKAQIQNQLDETHKGVAALDQVLTFVSSQQGTSRIHFRVYHEVEDGQIDLLVTSDDGK
jgi:serine/threonine-protein kinase